MNFQDLVYQFFCSTGGYTIESTTAFAVVLILFVYIIFKILKKLKVRIDKRLSIAILPFVLLGSSVRVLKDAGFLTGCLYQTPGIYFLVFGITFSLLLISLILQRKWQIPYFKIMFIIGLILLSPILGVLRFENLVGFGYVFLWLIPWIVGLWIIPWLLENKIVIGLHLFDATTTFVSLSYFGYYEQHVLPSYLIDFFGTPFSFVVLKFIVLALVLLGIDKFSEDKEFNTYIKLIIGILGASTGSRDLLRLLYPT
jgi:uncharacterized membrane protein